MHDGHHHEHENCHCHEHGQCRSHEHDGGHYEQKASLEEAKALLTYMADHNKSHTAEVAELAGQFDSAVQELINAAVESYSQGNTMLEQALSAIGD